MSQLQDIFNRIQEKKKEQKEIKAAYRDALRNDQQYQDLLEEIKQLREKKKSQEQAIQADFGRDFERLDELAADIQSDEMLLSDVAFNQMTEGETVSVTDAYNNAYEPIFKVSFRKVR